MNTLKKIIASIVTIATLCFPVIAAAQVITFPNRGGTGTSTIPTYGQVLVGQSNGTYGPQATSTLGLPTFSSIVSSLADYVLTTSFGGLFYQFFSATTTSALAEGSNLYWTNNRFDQRLTATTSLPSITTLENLSLSLVQTTGNLGVSRGGTGATTFGQGWLHSSGGTAALTASTSPTVNYLTATSTTATSQFSGFVKIAKTLLVGSATNPTNALYNLIGGNASGSGSSVYSDQEGSIVFGVAAGTNSFIASTLSGSNKGSLVGGYAFANDTSIQASESGSIVWGVTEGANSYIRSSELGSLTVGVTTGVGSRLSNAEHGSFIFGHTAGSNSIIETSGDGSSASGYAQGADSSIIAEGIGSTASGYVGDASSITTSGLGARAEGYANTTGAITASGNGAIAMGAAISDVLRADGNGSIALGESVQTDKNNAIVIGKNIDNLAAGVNLANSFSVGFDSLQFLVNGNNGNVGIGTTTPYAKLSVVGEIVASHFTSTTTATSTFGGNLAINGTGTTTSTGGFDISAGCFAVNGTCVTGGGASLSGGSTDTLTYWTSPTTVGATSSPVVGYITATTTTATSSFLGKVGVGGVGTDGTLHVKNGSAGSVTANTNSNTIVMEASGNSGFSLLTPDGNYGTIYFGSPSDNFGAQLAWSYNDQNLYISTQNASDDILFRTGDGSGMAKFHDNGSLSLGTTFHTTAGTASGAIIQGNVGIGTTTPSSQLDLYGGVLRVGGGTSPAYPSTGAGFEIAYDGDGSIGSISGGNGVSVFQSFSRTAGAWRDMWFRGADIGFDVSAVQKMKLNSGGTSFYDSAGTTIAASITTGGVGSFLSGVGTGAIRMGANVNAVGTLSNTTRKVGRIVVPSYSNPSNNISIFAADFTSASQNNVFFGTVPGGTSYGAQNMFFATTPSDSVTAASASTSIAIIHNVGVGIGNGYVSSFSGAAVNPSAVLSVLDFPGSVKNMFQVSSSTGSVSAPTAVPVITIPYTGNVGIGTTSPSSTADIYGSFSTVVTSVTGAITLTSSHQSVFIPTWITTSFVIDLPTTIGISGRQYDVTNAGKGVITIDANSTQTIMGTTTSSSIYVLNEGESVRLQATGTTSPAWLTLTR